MLFRSKFYPYLPENNFIPIADFIGKSLEIAKEEGILKISVACMAGKLCKYASKQFYTHASKEEQDLSLLFQQIKELGFTENDMTDMNWHYAKSVREALHSFSANAQKQILQALAKKALAFFQSIHSAAYFHLLLCDFDGTILFTLHSGKKHA